MKDGRDDALVPLAKVTKAHGLKGEFRAHPPAGSSENLQQVADVVLRKPGGAQRVFAVESARPRPPFVLMKLTGLERIEDVEPWIGAEVCVRRETLEALPEGDFYWHELTGMAVVNHDGRDWGRVEGLFATGSNDVLVVRQGSRERFIPYTDDAIASIDKDARTIVLANLPGLEDL